MWLLILPALFNWFAIVAFGIAVHEAGHYAAVCLFGGRVIRIQLWPRYAIWHTGVKTRWRLMAVSFAGPLMNIVLAIICYPHDQVSGCANAMFAIVNLLPNVNGSDGANILKHWTEAA